jgi:hypothetical protein
MTRRLKQKNDYPETVQNWVWAASKAWDIPEEELWQKIFRKAREIPDDEPEPLPVRDGSSPMYWLARQLLKKIQTLWGPFPFPWDQSYFLERERAWVAAAARAWHYTEEQLWDEIFAMVDGIYRGEIPAV